MNKLVRNETIALSNGLEVPLVGLGAKGIWLKNGEYDTDLVDAQRSIYEYALEQTKGLLFDTSAAYGLNERILGEVIRDKNMEKNVTIMTKVSNKAQERGDIRAALEKSLDALQMQQIDIYLMHWPYTEYYIDTWKQMEKLYEEGLVRAIGVCNCHRHHLEHILTNCCVKPMLNEVEIHPLFTQDELITYCSDKNIKMIAYTPLARMHDVLINSRTINELMQKYDRTQTQIIMQWHYQKKQIAIPSTLSVKHFDEIFFYDEFELDDVDVQRIDELNDNVRLRYNPDKCDFTRL